MGKKKTEAKQSLMDKKAISFEDMKAGAQLVAFTKSLDETRPKANVS